MSFSHCFSKKVSSPSFTLSLSVSMKCVPELAIVLSVTTEKSHIKDEDSIALFAKATRAVSPIAARALIAAGVKRFGKVTVRNGIRSVN